MWLIQLPQRQDGYDVFANQNINEASIRKLAESTEVAWKAILNQDARTWGSCTCKCFEAQREMFPNTASQEILNMIESCCGQAYGWKLTGAGGGGYLLLISDAEIKNAVKIQIRS